MASTSFLERGWPAFSFNQKDSAAGAQLTSAIFRPEVGRKPKENACRKFLSQRILSRCFAPLTLSHMKPFGVELDSYTFMSNPDNANKVLATLSPHDGQPPTMPPGGPYWTADQLALFAQWQSGGYLP